MKQANRLKYRLNLGFLYFHCILSSALVVDFEEFTRWAIDNARINNVEAAFYNRTALECALICTHYHGCVSFNIHPSGSCEINTKPFDYYTIAYLNQASWKLYERGDCGLGIGTSKHCLMFPRFLYHEYGSHALSWSESKDTCMKGHANLVEVYDETEMQELNQELNNIFPNLGDWVGKLWSGLNKIETADFVWDNMAAPVYNNYVPGEPYMAHDCVIMTNYQSSWVWKTEVCSNSWSFVCERRDVK